MADRQLQQSFWQSLAVKFLLVAIGAILFSISFPSFLTKWGLFPLAYVALVPAFVLVRRCTWPEVFFFGFLYGMTTYTLHNYWLTGFHPLALIAVPLIYATYFIVVFPLLKLCIVLLPRYGHLLQLVVWIAYEFLRTQFFLGYSYGIIGYTQYLFLPLVRFSSLGGIWAVSILVAFPGIYLGNALANGWSGLSEFVRTHRIDAIAWGTVFVAAIAFGLATTVDYSDSRMWRVALIQQNSDPLAGGPEAYKRSLDISLRLSEEAVKENPDVVVWSETSVVPPIDYHTRYRTNPDSYGIVERLEAYLAHETIPYVIGNASSRLLRNENGGFDRIDYNAVIVYHDGRFTEPYRKTHLVPFTETFPYAKQLPRLSKLLEENGTNQWGKGDEFTVFEVDGIRFSTPICFEDTFGYITREFVNRGADVIVNLTNDLWSKSVAASMQHMQMAVFRAGETRKAVVRSTNGGMTTIIDPNGRITAILEPFVEGYLVGDVPVFQGRRTLYLRWGDWLAWVAIAVSAAGIIAGAVVTIVQRRKR